MKDKYEIEKQMQTSDYIIYLLHISTLALLIHVSVRRVVAF